MLIFPTLKATKKTFEVCNKHFGKSHHKSNSANAFRHVLWNLLICRHTFNYTKNKQKSVFWAQKVGDLYEKVTQNNALDEAMDLHNNAVGRIYFLNLFDKTEEETLQFLLTEVNNAQQVIDIKQMDRFRNKMIYID